jgi:hypothetical protein
MIRNSRFMNNTKPHIRHGVYGVLLDVVCLETKPFDTSKGFSWSILDKKQVLAVFTIWLYRAILNG